MVACTRFAADLPIDAGILKTLCQNLAHEKMIKPQTRIPIPSTPHVVPECIDAFTRMKLAQTIGPTLLH